MIIPSFITSASFDPIQYGIFSLAGPHSCPVRSGTGIPADTAGARRSSGMFATAVCLSVELVKIFKPLLSVCQYQVVKNDINGAISHATFKKHLFLQGDKNISPHKSGIEKNTWIPQEGSSEAKKSHRGINRDVFLSKSRPQYTPPYQRYFQRHGSHPVARWPNLTNKCRAAWLSQIWTPRSAITTSVRDRQYGPSQDLLQLNPLGAGQRMPAISHLTGQHGPASLH